MKTDSLHSKRIIHSLVLAFTLVFCGCVSTSLSTATGGDYDAKTNTTAYFVLPLGSVSLPGKWTKDHYNSVSNQQFFKNADSVSVAIAFTQCNSYEFSRKDLKDFAFVKAYYEWDSKYLAERLKVNREILVKDSLQQYIVWRLFGPNVESYFLFANKNCAVHNYYVSTPRWTKEEKVKFLQELYLKK